MGRDFVSLNGVMWHDFLASNTMHAAILRANFRRSKEHIWKKAIRELQQSKRRRTKDMQRQILRSREMRWRSWKSDRICNAASGTCLRKNCINEKVKLKITQWFLEEDEELTTESPTANSKCWNWATLPAYHIRISLVFPHWASASYLTSTTCVQRRMSRADSRYAGNLNIWLREMKDSVQGLTQAIKSLLYNQFATRAFRSLETRKLLWQFSCQRPPGPVSHGDEIASSCIIDL